MAFVLKEKLKALKFFLKDWHKSEFGSVDNRINVIIEEIRVLDVRGESTGLNNY
jgi:hypothetical protein